MTPRNYLSFTQMQLFERSPERYRQVYLDGEEQFENGAMRLGKRIHDATETDESTDDPFIDMVVSSLPKLDSMNFEIEGTLNGVPLYGKLDSFNSKTKKAFKEYKTGRTAWTQKKVDSCDQITFYCSLIYAKYGIRPEGLDIELVYLPTDYNDEGIIEPTGEQPARFKTHRNFIDLMKISSRQKNSWEGIKKMSLEFAINL
jgi:hypothetical protein